MKYRTLDESGDYTLGKNIFLTDKEAVAQAILTRMKLLYAEWWEDTEDGLPLFEKILGVYGTEENKNAVDLIISERILGTKGVKSISSYDSTIQSRDYKANIRIETMYGEVNLEFKSNNDIITINLDTYLS